MTTATKIAILSKWIDESYATAGVTDAELILRRRIGKLMNESGEVAQALEGYTGENPRKGVFDTKEHVMEELLDVAITALGAYEHMDNYNGDSLLALHDKINRILVRAGLIVDHQEETLPQNTDALLARVKDALGESVHQDRYPADTE